MLCYASLLIALSLVNVEVIASGHGKRALQHCWIHFECVCVWGGGGV